MWGYVSLVLITIIALLAIMLSTQSAELKTVRKQLKEVQNIANTVANANQYYKEAEDMRNQASKDVEGLKKELHSLKKERQSLQSDLEKLTLESFAATVRIDTYADMRSDEVKNKLSILRAHQDELVKEDKALTVSKSTDVPKKILNNRKKQVLRCFNAECANILDHMTAKNVNSARGKIERSYATINKMFESDNISITKGFLSSKLEELSLMYAYLVKVEEEREQRKAIREQMVEEEKVRREIEAAKKKLLKEETQFSNEIKKLMGYMQKAKNEVESRIYAEQITELQEKLKDIHGQQENVLQREQNTRAGFVYIISNIGSFGENVFKIGMTRRLEPMDRIAELSSASVPFPFDVHAMIFSEDAPSLESTLHKYFSAQRVNQANARKEFFRIDLEEIKKVVLENHNATVEFVDVPAATEYRETLKIEQTSLTAVK